MGQSGRPDLYDSRRGCLHHHLSKRLERGHLAFRFLPAIGCRQTTIRQITSLPGRSCLRIRFGRKRRNARSISRIVFETVHGVRINPYLFAGVGLGINYFYKDIYFSNGWNIYELGNSGTVLPVFANVKGYLPVSSKAALNLSWDLGAAIGVGVTSTRAPNFTPPSARASRSAVRAAECGAISASAFSTWEKD